MKRINGFQIFLQIQIEKCDIHLYSLVDVWNLISLQLEQQVFWGLSQAALNFIRLHFLSISPYWIAHLSQVDRNHLWTKNLSILSAPSILPSTLTSFSDPTKEKEMPPYSVMLKISVSSNLRCYLHVDLANF